MSNKAAPVREKPNYTDIQEGVPLPPSARSIYYPVDKLEKEGQSFFASGAPTESIKRTIKALGRKHAVPLRLNVQKEGEVTGVRAWRAAPRAKSA